MKDNYPKVICACCFAFLFVNVGMPSTSFSVYQPYLVQMVGDANGSVVLSVRTFATLATMFFVNRYYNRLGCRMAVFVGTLLTAGGFICYSLADGMPLLVAGSLLAGCGYSFGGVVGMTLLIGRWYKSRVGTAVGIATVGSGFAGMVIPAIAVHVIEGVSLHASFLAEGLFAAAAAFVMLALIRNHPSDVGARPFGEGGEGSSAKTRGKAPQADAAHLHRHVRVLLVAAMACVGMTCVGAMAYVSILLTTNGFDAQFAAAMLSLVGACLTVSKFATGELFDRIGTLKGSTIIFAAGFAGLVLFCFVPSHVWLVVVIASVLYGFGVATGSVGISVWSLELSNPETRAKTVRDFQIGYALGGFIGDTFPGFLAQSCGSYVYAYVVFALGALFTAVVITMVYRRYRA